MIKGTEVKLIDTDKTKVNWGGNDDPGVYLMVGNVYTVHSVDVHRWHTKILLDEMPGRWFNDSHFEEMK